MKKGEPNNRLLTDAQLGVIKIFLPHGSRRLLATEHEVSDAYVGQVLNGKKNNVDILFKALNLAIAEKESGKNGPPDHFGPILVDQVNALLF